MRKEAFVDLHVWVSLEESLFADLHAYCFNKQLFQIYFHNQIMRLFTNLFIY